VLLDTLALEPILMDRDGVKLAHYETGTASLDSPPLVFINGWTGDHGIFSPQISYFAETHHVVAVNLRGHGASDRPKQEYTIEGFADDIAWQCRQLGLKKPVLIGHSMGGIVGMELSGRHQDLPAGLVMIDSIVMPPPALREDERLKQFIAGIAGPNYLEFSRASAWNSVGNFDDPSRMQAIFERYVLPSCAKTPQHVAYSALKNWFFDHNPVPAAKRCTVPIAYIAADVPVTKEASDLDRLQELCPQVVIAQTLLAGHFSTVEVSDQVNAMLDRFLAVGLSPSMHRAVG
jgi:pimeloyl-ACP methyl ester carboxylesterase